MKLSIVSITLLISLIGGMLYTIKTRPKQLFIGFYDPTSTFLQDKRVSIQNEFFSWNVDATTVENSINSIEKLNRIPLITLEPWQQQGDNSYLQNIIKGNYDNYISGICKVFANSKAPVMIRWGHEMELKTLRYPWSASNPDDYKAAYRYFVTKCKSFSSGNKLLFVWSPSGESGLEDYWPGGGYVDLIGLSSYSYDQWDTKNVGHVRSFVELISPKYEKVKGYNKPIILAEAATTGTDDYKKSWLVEGAKSLSDFPRVIALVYFNAKDAEGAWGKDYGTPDWNISAESIDPFLSKNAITVKDDSLDLLSQQLLQRLQVQ